MQITAQELAQILQGKVDGNASVSLSRIAAIQSADEGDLSFLANRRYEKFLAETNASAVIVAESQPVDRRDLTLIRVKDPYLGFLQALKLFYEPEQAPWSAVHPAALIEPTASVHPSAAVGPMAYVGTNAAVGEGSVVGAGCVIGNGVTIGRNCLLHPNVTVIAKATIGDSVIIHAGTTIGSDGFGFAPKGGAYEKIPQTGTVVIEDDVEIGANCAIDRATIGSTVIGKGSKLDNLIQVAHNVEIGSNTVIAAQSGVSGSTRLGSNVIIAGQVGLVGHIDVGDGVTVTAQSGVSKSISGTGKVFRGSPAREMHEELRQEAAIRQLPDVIAAVRKLEARLKELEELTHHQSEADPGSV